MLALLIALIWLASIGAIVWWYRRKQAQRAAQSALRFEQMFGAMRGVVPLSPAAAILPASGLSATSAAITPATVSAKRVRRARFFPQAYALLYYVLRTGLPDHAIFARHELRDLLEEAPASEGRAPGGPDPLGALARRRIDFVVCNKQLEIVAAIVVQDAMDTAYPALARCLDDAGVRLLAVNPTALPRHHEIRGLIYGDVQPPA